MVGQLEGKLDSFFESYRCFFKTKTRDSAHHGFSVLKSYFLLETGRNYVNIDQKMNGIEKDGQDIQNFMSDSPWQWAPLFQQVQRDIGLRLGLGGGTLNFDESGDECHGGHKAGASRQYIGRLGKIEMGQVGVLSSYYQDGVWVLTDAELYLPEAWFEKPELKERWNSLHIPEQREFQTKIELARQQFGRALSNGLDFSVAGMDSFYGRDGAFRKYIDSYNKYYMACIPNDVKVWLEDPLREGAPLKGNLSKTVKSLVKQAEFEPIKVRDGERGDLVYEHAFIPVWTVLPNEKGAKEPWASRRELLVIRKEPNAKHSYALSNAEGQVPKQTIACWRAERYFVERTIQDAKSELGWDELQAQKYRAYMHTLALCALALLFMGEVKLEQRQHYQPLDEIQQQLKVKRLPDLSLANVKELMRAVMPLPALSKEQARKKVIQTLFKRAKSTESRIRKNDTS